MPALIFDLDGTLVDTVYAHVFAWQRALAEAGLPIDGWRIHRRIGMSGGLFTRAVARELGRALTSTEVEAIQARHGQLFRELLPERRPFPEAVELLAELRTAGVPWGIATSGRRPEINASLEALGLGSETVVVERGDVERAKPEPDLFLACAAQLAVPPRGVTSSATPSGTCSLHAGRGCSASGFSAAATERTSWPAPAPFASTETRASSGSRWTS
jgi:beta-phosphoglucomutase-like phosphatase (HAD superfamily)